MSHLRILSILAALLIAAPPVLASVDEDLYSAGRNAVFEERWSDAKDSFTELTRRFPSSPLVDDAFYWIGMAWHELGDGEKAYTVLKQMSDRYPESPWSDDARALMVRCAEMVLKEGGFPTDASGALRRDADGSDRTEYEEFIERSTQDSSAKVKLLAIDSVLSRKPEKAGELLPQLGSDRSSREAESLLLDRFFEGEHVKVTLENPVLGLEENNVAVMVRQGDEVIHLTLSQAVEIAHPDYTGGRFDADIREEIRSKILQAERVMVQDGEQLTERIEGGDRSSAIFRVADGEFHYYRNGRETTRILVLNRQAGFDRDNIHVFVETGSGLEQVPLDRIRKGAGGEVLPGVSDSTIRYIKAALAIIELEMRDSSGS